MAAEAQRASADFLGAQHDSPNVHRRIKTDPYWAHYNDASADRWEATVLPKVLAIADLNEGWDGYAAKSISWDTCMFALIVLNNTMRATTPCPQIVPTASSAIQLEWHERQIDLEVKISGPYRCEVFFEDHAHPGAAPVELALSADLTPLLSMVDDLSSR